MLERKLIERTAASEQRRLRKLFTAEGLGDLKPTQLLLRMQLLLGDKRGTTDESIIKELFMQRMPPNTRMVLASMSESTPLDELATLADKIREVATLSIAAVNVPSQASDEMEQLRVEFARLEQQISVLQAPTGPTQSQSRSHNRPQPRSPSQQESVGIIGDSATLPSNARSLVPRRETARPATSGDELRWPSDKLPLFRDRPLHKNAVSG